MGFLLRLPTARAALIALVGALLVFLRQTGVAVPADLDHRITVGIDVVLSFCTLLGSFSAFHRMVPPAAPPPPDKPAAGPPGAGTASLVGLVLVALTGCAGTFEEARGRVAVGSTAAATAPPSARCVSLDDASATWAATAEGAAVLAGTSGLATIPAPGQWDPFLVGSSVGFAAVAAFSGVEAHAKATSWARECAQ